MKIFNYTIVIAVIFFFSVDLRTQSPFEKTEEMLNMNNAGTEFLFTFHPGWEELGTNINFINIYVTSNVETYAKLEIPDINFKETKKVFPYEITHFYLTPEQALAYKKTDRITPHPVQVYEKKAIILTAQDPVICYAMLNFLYAKDKYLVLPTHVLGKEYVVASYGDPRTANSENPRFQWLTSYTSIVGVKDNTHIEFRVGGNNTTWVPDKTTNEKDGITSGNSFTSVVNRGDILLVPAMGFPSDLTGSYIKADKPVAVFSGSFCGYVPAHIAPCDYIIAQEYPIETWGTKYHVTPIANREKNSYVSIFAKEDNTVIYRDGIEFISINRGKGGTLEENAYKQLRISETNAPISGFTLTSDDAKLFSVTQYNTGTTDDMVNSLPFQMSLIPIEQYSEILMFSTPGLESSNLTDSNFINIIYLANEDGSIPDDLQLGRFIDGNLHWEQVNSLSSDNEFQLYTSDRSDNRSYFVKQIKLIWGHGVYQLRANDKIAVYSYGGTPYDTYGTPGASFVNYKNSDDILPPKIEIISDTNDYRNISLYIRDISNTQYLSGLTSVFFPSVVHKKYSYQIEDFELDKEDCYVHLQVDDYSGEAQAAIFAMDRAGNYSTATYTFKPERLPTLLNADMDFGLVRVGETHTKDLILKNLNDEDTFEIFDFKIENTSEVFNLTLNRTFPFIMSPNEEIPVTLTFSSDEEDSYDSRLLLTLSDIEYPFGYLKAATGQAFIEVNDISFGIVAEHNKINRRAILIKNQGILQLEISKIEFTGDIELELELEKEVSEQNPLIIPKFSQQYIFVNAQNKTPGEYFSQIKFYSNGSVIKDISNAYLRIYTTSVSEKNQFGIQILQNSEQIYFESSENPLIEKIEIYTMDGKKVYESRNRINVNELRYDTTALSNGVYFINLTLNNKVISFKFLISGN